MKKEVADQWVAALRSGQYEQGRSALRVGEKSYCCLGVLCDISKRGRWSGGHEGNAVFEDADGETAVSYLPHGVMKWAGMRTEHGLFKGKELKQMTLSDLNDSGEVNFEMIADLIENHWESL